MNFNIIIRKMLLKEKNKKSKIIKRLSNKNNSKIKIFKYIIFIISLFLFIAIVFNLVFNFSYNFNNKNNENKKISELNFDKQRQYEYENFKFAILTRKCPGCGFFSHYIVHLGCILTFIQKGYIPIIELNSFENVFNGFNISSNDNNPWEVFFNQPFGYTLNEVISKAKNVEHFKCYHTEIMRPNEISIYQNQLTINFYHYLAKKYMPIKQEIIDECNMIRKKLFGYSKNILGILARGTDYVNLRPSGNSIPPTPEIMIKDVKKMNENNKYDYFFLATEDYTIRDKFINFSLINIK